jgi:hypothetical protein
MSGLTRKSIEALGQTVTGQHVRVTFSERLRSCLRFAADHPELLEEIGVVSSAAGGVLGNHKALSALLGLKPNSLARNFRDQHYVLDPHYDPSRELLARLPAGSRLDTRKWSLRRHSIEDPEPDTQSPWSGSGSVSDETVDDSAYDTGLGEDVINDAMGMIL